MADNDILVLVEEASAREIVLGIAKQLGLSARVKVLTHNGVDELKKSVAVKIANDPFFGTRFLVLRDADGKDCRAIKKELVAKVPKAKMSRTSVRIVCQELEAWYLAQPEALERAGSLQKSLPKSLRSRDPDAIAKPKREFRKYAHQKGQIEHARRIAMALDFDSARSRSFKHFVTALQRLADL